MSTPVTPPPLDFTVIREDWNRYDLTDNSILKVKIVLTRVFRNGTRRSADFQPIVIVLSNERGEPSTRTYSPQEIQAAVINDVRYRTVSQDWNEYVVDDGTRIRLQPMIIRVAKTSLFNNRGEPIYWVETQSAIDIRPPTPGA